MKEALLKAKLEQCTILCQFESCPPDGSNAYTSTDALSDPQNRLLAGEGIFISPAELRNREIKRSALIELIEYISTSVKTIPDSIYPQFFQMVQDKME